MYYCLVMDEGRKRGPHGIMAVGDSCASASAHSRKLLTILFGGTARKSTRSDKLIAASVQWAEKIMEKIDNAFRSSDLP